MGGWRIGIAGNFESFFQHVYQDDHGRRAVENEIGKDCPCHILQISTSNSNLKNQLQGPLNLCNQSRQLALWWTWLWLLATTSLQHGCFRLHFKCRAFQEHSIFLIFFFESLDWNKFSDTLSETVAPCWLRRSVRVSQTPMRRTSSAIH